MRCDTLAIHYNHASIQIPAIQAHQNIQPQHDYGDDCEGDANGIAQLVIPYLLPVGEHHAHLHEVVHDGPKHEPVPNQHDGLRRHEYAESRKHKPGERSFYLLLIGWQVKGVIVDEPAYPILFGLGHEGQILGEVAMLSKQLLYYFQEPPHLGGSFSFDGINFHECRSLFILSLILDYYICDCNITLGYYIHYYKISTLAIFKHSLQPISMSNIVKIIAVALLISGIVQSRRSKQKIISPSQYEQTLQIIPDTQVAKIEFLLGTAHLPIPLQNLIAKTRNQIRIQYGPYFHQVKDFSNQLITFNGITTQIESNSLNIDPLLKETLQATFVISLSERYSYYFNFSDSAIFNDPNDKFCRHHIQQIIRNLLPCSTNAGLAQLIDLDSFFSIGENGNRLYGMRVQWNRNYMKIQLMMQMKDGRMEGIKKIRINQKCLANSKLNMTDASKQKIGLKQIVISRLQQSMAVARNEQRQKPNQQQKQVYLSRSVIGNWYNPSKKLQLLMKETKSPNNSYYVVRQLLPQRAGVYKVVVTNLHGNATSIFHTHQCEVRANPTEHKYNQPSTFCEVSLRISNIAEEKQTHFFKIDFFMENKLICFDNYETSFGGGYELANIPISIIQVNDNFQMGGEEELILARKIFTPPTSLRTPQPDQSLPFQVITFTMGIFGYLWLSVWRKFAHDLKKRRNAKQHNQDKTD